jgi:hypothetical protein
MIASSERREQLSEVWFSLCRFHQAYGRFPEHLQEWSEFEPRAAELLAAPRWSRSGDYEIDFVALGDASPTLLVRDPGMRWPGDPDYPHHSFRVSLRNDGALIKGDPESEDAYVWFELPPCDELGSENGGE